MNCYRCGKHREDHDDVTINGDTYILCEDGKDALDAWEAKADKMVFVEDEGPDPNDRVDAKLHERGL